MSNNAEERKPEVEMQRWSSNEFEEEVQIEQMANLKGGKRKRSKSNSKNKENPKTNKSNKKKNLKNSKKG